MAKFTIQYLGKIYEANTKKDLYNKLKAVNLSKARVDKLLKNEGKELYIIQDNINISKMDITKNIKPLLMRDFNIPASKLEDKKISRVIKHKNIKISRNIPKDADIMNAVLKITMTLNYSDEEEERVKTIQLNDIPNTEEAIINIVNDAIYNYMAIDNPELIKFDYEIISKYNNAKYEIKDMKLRDSKPLKIYNENIEMIETEQNCVINYLLKNYKKISPKKIKELDNDGVTPEQLKTFCEKYKIKFRCYDITKNLISSYNPEKNKRGYKKMIIMAFNNHIYPLKNKPLNTFNKEKPIIYVEDAKAHLIDYINNGNYPDDVKIDKNKLSIVSYETNTHVYTSNQDFNKIKDLFKKLGIEDKMKPNIKIPSLNNYLIPLYVKENIKSIWLGHDNFTKDGYSYKNPDVKYNIDDVTTLDKNKCYSYVLKNLPYLISVDFKTDKVKTDIKEITDHYLYVVKPEKHNILIPNTNVYAGYHVKYALKEGVKLEIKEEISTTKHDNYFTDMINDIYSKTDEKTAKDIINFMIGKMQTPTTTHTYSKFVKVANEDESNRTNGFSMQLTDDYKLFYEFKESNSSIYTMKPIAFQIKDQSRVLMYEKMKSLKLHPDKIIQCKTDSFSFVNDKKIKFETSTHFNDWKTENFKPLTPSEYYNYDVSLIPGCLSCNSKLITGDAGNGKTYHILNKIIPNIKNYIVLTPSHATLRQYKKLKHNCSVIQKYTFKNEIPSENIIIVDEIGMCDGRTWDMLIKCILFGKSVYALGDFTQLLPVGCNNPYDNNLLINSLFTEKEHLHGNHRNNFTPEYYNKLKTTKDNNYLLDEVKKYNTPWEDAQYIIAYRNTTKDKYNKMKLKQLNLNFGDVGCRVICKSNDLSEHDIYNNFIYTITENDEGNITIDDGIKEQTITLKHFYKNFKPAYAITLYCVQGDNIKSYHYPDEDKDFINNRSSYTLISRLKTK